MPVTTRQIGPCFAAEVEGVDMTKPLSEEEVDAIHAGMNEHAVLVFHDQDIDDEQQLAFTQSLGDIEFAIGTRLWHSDSSFKVIPAKYSLLHARSIPSKGGNTEFADMRAAYGALDAETRAE